MNPFDAASPFDARYYFADKSFFDRLHPYVAELSQVKYLAKVEAALAETLADHGVCSQAMFFAMVTLVMSSEPGAGPPCS